MNIKHYNFLLYLLLPFFILGQSNDVIDSDTIKVAYDVKMIGDVKINDVESAMNIWGNEFLRGINTKLDKQFILDFHVVPDLSYELKNKSKSDYDILGVRSIDFIEFANEDYWEAHFSTVEAGDSPQPLIIVVRKDANIATIEDLANKSFMIPEGPFSYIFEMWLNDLLAQRVNTTSEKFFSKITSHVHKTKGALTVFFKKADACITIKTTFETLCELNPQLRKHLKVIETSPPFAKNLMLVKKDFGKMNKQILIDSFKHLNKTTTGKQVLTLFGESHLVPFKEEYLAPLRELVKRRQK